MNHRVRNLPPSIAAKRKAFELLKQNPLLKTADKFTVITPKKSLNTLQAQAISTSSSHLSYILLS